MLSSYPSIFGLSHKAMENLFSGYWQCEEKVDGSQFSFQKKDDQLFFRSKSVEIFPDAPEKMFRKGVEYIISVKNKLVNGWIYRSEFLKEPKHNVLAYSRIPKNHIMIFDIEIGEQKFLSHERKHYEASILGVECVRSFGRNRPISEIIQMLEKESSLGGCLVEGVVVKNYEQFGADKKILVGKLVSENFKESHEKEWGESIKSQTSILEKITTAFRTEARWLKAVQHLKEKGELVMAPQDIGKLIREIPADVFLEHEQEMKEILWKWASPTIQRGLTKGFPEWYKKYIHENFLNKI